MSRMWPTTSSPNLRRTRREIAVVGEVAVEGVVAEGEHLRAGERIGPQRERLVAVLRVADPGIRELPFLFHGHRVELGAGVGHRAVEVGELAVRLQREVERLLHGLAGVVGQPEDVVADHVDAGVLDLLHHLEDLGRAEAALLHAVAHVLAARLDAEREPAEAGAGELVEELVLDGVHARVGPDVEIVAALDDAVADAEHVVAVQHEHLVHELDVLHAVLLDEEIDFLDHALRRPQAVGGLAERRVDAAERALVGAAEARVHRDVGRAVMNVLEAVPVVGAVLLHRQQVPGDARHLAVEIVHQFAVRVGADRFAVAVPQARDLREVACARLQCLRRQEDRLRPLAVADEIDLLLQHRALGQRGRMRAGHHDPPVPAQRLDRGAGLARGGHVLRGSRGLKAVHHHHDQRRLEVVVNGFGDAGGTQIERRRVHDRDRQAVLPQVGREQSRERRRLDRRKAVAELLVHGGPAAGIYQQHVDSLSGSRHGDNLREVKALTSC